MNILVKERWKTKDWQLETERRNIMVQITLKSMAAIKELLSITKESITLEVSEEVASKFFGIAMEKRLLQDVEFENKEESARVSNEKKQEKKKSNKGLTAAIKNIFEENPKRELTSKEIRRELPNEFKKTTAMAAILKWLSESGYVQENSVEGVKKYKKAE